MRPSKRKRWVRWFGLFVSLPLTLLLLASSWLHMRARQVEAHNTALMQGIGSLTHAAMLYAQEHDGRLPATENWEQTLQPETGPLPLELPPAPGGTGRRIAFNRALTGRALDTLPHPEHAILFYESTADGSNISDNLDSLVPAGDPSPLLFGFADGHVEDFPASRRAEILKRANK